MDIDHNVQGYQNQTLILGTAHIVVEACRLVKCLFEKTWHKCPWDGFMGSPRVYFLPDIVQGFEVIALGFRV